MLRSVNMFISLHLNEYDDDGDDQWNQCNGDAA